MNVILELAKNKKTMKNKTLISALLFALFLSNATFGQEQTNPQQSPKKESTQQRDNNSAT